MKTNANYGIRVLATGFMVLVFLCILSFWGRFVSQVFLAAHMPVEAKTVEISPLGILPEAIENDPNADLRSKAVATMDGGQFFETLGITRYIFSNSLRGDRSDVFWYSPDKSWMYFDRSSGRIVFRDVKRVKRDDGVMVERVTPTYYAGSQAVSESSEENVGRFRDPIPVLSDMDRHILYDRKLHRFFAIDRATMSITAGPQLKDADLRWPAKTLSDTFNLGLGIYAQPPGKQLQGENADGRRRYLARVSTGSYHGRYHPVLDASGRIDLLDRQTLELIPNKGMLPIPETLFGRGSRRPSQLLKFQAEPIYLGSDYEYIGMMAASVSRQGTSMALAIFDRDGRQVKRADSRAMSYQEKERMAAASLGMSEGELRNLVGRRSPWIKSARAALFDAPWAPAVTVCRYLLENLHPPILTVASFFLADRIEAYASHRSVFLMPNSFAAMHRDQVREGIVMQFFEALWTMLPAIGLAIVLAWRVSRDAGAIGLPGRVRTLWWFGTLAFGLPAYITYRMTRSADSLVTCATCGKPRRSDMERCHLCNGAWEVPELVPPAWRVLDGKTPSDEQGDGSEKVVDSGEHQTDSSVKTM
jgi:hypothetical protein